MILREKEGRQKQTKKIARVPDLRESSSRSLYRSALFFTATAIVPPPPPPFFVRATPLNIPCPPPAPSTKVLIQNVSLLERVV